VSKVSPERYTSTLVDNDRHALTPLQVAFLNAYALTGEVSGASKAAHIDRTTHYTWLDDPNYVRAFQGAKQAFRDRLEAAALQRAVEGVEEPVYQGGKLVGYKTKYSDQLLVRLLVANLPEKYRDTDSLVVAANGDLTVIDDQEGKLASAVLERLRGLPVPTDVIEAEVVEDA
jgi:hypothetical protein